jgi:hypothetical protein
MTMKSTKRLYFSYSQFMIYDQSVDAPGCLWTEAHSAQGFARRQSTACFQTLVEFGYASVRWKRGRFTPKPGYERVIAVPFRVVSGRVLIEGPEEQNVGRFIDMASGDYRLVAAQLATSDEAEDIDLFFEPLDAPLAESSVIVADESLSIPERLVEDASVA